MTTNKDLKNCKHCMTEISRRARICPQCHQPNSFAAAVKGFFKTGGWVVTSCIAGWYGISEHAEKVGLKDEVVATQENLKAKSRQLIAANFTKDALRKRWGQMASYTPLGSSPFGDSTGTGDVRSRVLKETGTPSASYAATAPAVGEEPYLERLRDELDAALKAEPFDERLVERLTSEIVAAELGG